MCRPGPDLGQGVQVRPVKEETRNDRPAGQAGKEVHAVRLGAGDRSYLVRDKQIEVLKNVYGGVQVSPPPLSGTESAT